jgi:hypothetical protein
MAREHQAKAINPGFGAAEIRELKHARWAKALEEALLSKGRTPNSLAEGRFAEPWKVELAKQLRDEAGASSVWLAENLQMGSPNSVRSWLSRSRGNQQLSA